MASVYRIMGQDSPKIIGSGHVAAFDDHRIQLLNFQTARCGVASDAEDLLQELWIRVSTQATGPIASPRSYLFRMANNLALNHARTRRRAMARDNSWLSTAGHGQVAVEDRPDPDPGADELLASRQEAELLHRAIAALPAGAQRALRLHRIEGHDQKEVARIMGISRSGVEKHLATAMKHLRDTVAQWGWFGTAVSGKGGTKRDTQSPTEERT
jgi:RNA polymerase sigma-70 factor (ECF subfamily)